MQNTCSLGNFVTCLGIMTFSMIFSTSIASSLSLTPTSSQNFNSSGILPRSFDHTRPFAEHATLTGSPLAYPCALALTFTDVDFSALLSAFTTSAPEYIEYRKFRRPGFFKPIFWNIRRNIPERHLNG